MVKLQRLLRKTKVVYNHWTGTVDWIGMVEWNGGIANSAEIGHCLVAIFSTNTAKPTG